MAISQVDKIRIDKLLGSHAVGDIYLQDFYDGVKKNKYSNNDLLSYLVDYVSTKLINKVDINNKKLAQYLAGIKCVFDFVEDVPYSDLGKLRVLKDNYISFCTERGILQDELVLSCIDSITSEMKETIDEEHLEESEENLNQYVKRITELEGFITQQDKSIKELKAKITLLEQLDKNNKKTIEKKDERIRELQESVTPLQTEIVRLKKDVDRLTEELNAASKELESYKTLVTQGQEELAAANAQLEQYRLLSVDTSQEILDLNAKVDRLTAEVDAYKKDQEKREEESRRLDALKSRCDLLDNFIVSQLISGSFTAMSLFNKANALGMNVSIDDVRSSLKIIKSRVNISNDRIISFPEQYTITSPEVITDSTFNLSNKCNCLDMLLISDLHIVNFNDEVIRALDSVYDYALKNGISLILNLGDLLSRRNGLTKDVSFSNTYKLLESIINKLPRDEAITHAILGGNHDRDLLKYGVDPIRYIASERADVISLGYDRATINLGDKDHFMIHHVDKKFKAPLETVTYDTSDVNTSLNSYYERSGKCRDDSYIDLMGHFHCSRFDFANNIGIVPSLLKDRVKNGAWHLKIYFNTKGEIANMVFIPLVLDKKLETICEISHKKLILR